MNKNEKKSLPIVLYILCFIVAIFFELYWIGNFPYDYFMIIGIGLVVLITGYLTFDSIIKIHQEEIELRREQNDTMIKAQKAIYLATKKNSAQAEQMQIANLKAVNLLMDRMVETITEKQIEQKNSDPADISSLISQLSASNAKLAKEVQNAITVGQLLKANEDLIKNVQDVLNGKTDVNMNYTSPETESPVTSEPETDVTSNPETIIYEEPEVSDIPQQDTVAEPELETSEISETEDEISPESEDEISPGTEAEIPSETEDEIPPETEDMSDDDMISFMSTLSDDETKNTEDDISLSEDMTDDDDDIINIDNISLEELDAIDSDISEAEEAVADASQTVEAMEAAHEMDKNPGEMLTQEEIAKLFENL